MKRFILSFLLPFAFLGVFGLWFYKFIFLDKSSFFYWSSCDTPTTYRIGAVDQRFNLTEDEFLADIKQAETIWENSWGKQLFIYNPKGELTINLVFDQRQSLNNDINSLENTLKRGKSSLDPQIAEYEKLSLDFRNRLAALNERIAFWNNKGGAPEEEYNKLIEEQKELREQADRLNTMAKTLNQSTQTYNTQVGTLRQTINSFNQVIAQKPEEGLYNGKEKTIDIYFNINQSELVHTLTHELGHATGLGHVSDPQAIMYPYTTESLTLSTEDFAALQKVCEKQTIAKLAAQRLIIFLNALISKYEKQF